MISVKTIKLLQTMPPMQRQEYNIKENPWIGYGTDDELSAPTKPASSTPRNSKTGGSSSTNINTRPVTDVRGFDHIFKASLTAGDF